MHLHYPNNFFIYFSFLHKKSIRCLFSPHLLQNLHFFKIKQNYLHCTQLAEYIVQAKIVVKYNIQIDFTFWHGMPSVSGYGQNILHNKLEVFKVSVLQAVFHMIHTEKCKVTLIGVITFEINLKCIKNSYDSTNREYRII